MKMNKWIILIGCHICLAWGNHVQSLYQKTTASVRNRYFVDRGHPQCGYVKLSLLDISVSTTNRLFVSAKFCAEITSCDYYYMPDDDDVITICTFNLDEFLQYRVINNATLDGDAVVWVKQDNTQYVYPESGCDVWAYDGATGGYNFNHSDVADGAITSMSFYQRQTTSGEVAIWQMCVCKSVTKT